MQKAAAFNAAMALAVAEMPATGTYDFGWVAEHVRDSEEQAGSGGDKRVILVDVGGGQGQILKSILEENPEIPPNRCVLEDQSKEAVHADVDGVMSSVGRRVTSFFHEQPVKGAFLTERPPSSHREYVSTPSQAVERRARTDQLIHII